MTCFQSWERTRHEKFSEVVSHGRSHGDGSRCFERAAVRARRRRSKHSELAGLSAAPSGIEAAIVSTPGATVPSTQGTLAPALSCFAHSPHEKVGTGSILSAENVNLLTSRRRDLGYSSET